MSDGTWDFKKRPVGPPPAPARRATAPAAQAGAPQVGSPPAPLAPATASVPLSPPRRPQPAPSVPALANYVGSGYSAAGGYLPPTPPPTGQSPAVVPESTQKRPPGRFGWRALVAFVAGGLLAAAGFASARIGDTTDAAAAPGEITVPVRSGQPAPPPLVVEPPDFDTDEPAAFVAKLLGPSVVQIEIPNLGLGSGVVVGDGIIVTNQHVIEGATEVDIRTADGRVLAGEVLGSDDRTDIAVISVGTGTGLSVAEVAVGEAPEVGQLTIAIGSPFQLQQTVTSGIVSAVNRPIFNGVGLNAMIQTDAAINPGNSGGALADRNGRVIGINTAIQTDGIGNSNLGVGFAIPIDTAMNIVNRILAGQSMEPGFLGVSGIESSDGSAGVQVSEITAGSGADLAGLLIDDLIISIDGAPVTSIEELAGLVQTNFPEEQVQLGVVRDGEAITLTATLGQR